MKYELMIPRLGVHYLYGDVMEYLWELSVEFPGAVTVTSIGETWEDRPIPLVTIATGNRPHEERPALLFTGAHHPREAISV